MSIRWTKTVEIEQEVKLVVDTNPDVEPDDLDELLGALRDANLDDLRKACEAVGLVVAAKKEMESEFAAAHNVIDALEKAGVDQRLRAEKAELLVAELETALINLNSDLRGVDVHTIQTIRTNIGALDGEPVTVAAGRVVTDLAGWKARAIVAESRVTELETERDAAIARAEKAERERDAFGAKNVEFHRAYGDEQARARATIASLYASIADLESRLASAESTKYFVESKLVSAESRLAALTAPVEGEPSDAELERAYYNVPPEVIQSKGYAIARRAMYRLGVQHERARHTRDLPRATDEELRKVFADAWDRVINAEAPGMAVPDVTARHAAILAVAAHVRREQCLVTRAVEMGVDLHIEVDGSGSVWVIEAVDRTGSSREIEVDSPSDVARVLSEILGEVK